MKEQRGKCSRTNTEISPALARPLLLCLPSSNRRPDEVDSGLAHPCPVRPRQKDLRELGKQASPGPGTPRAEGTTWSALHVLFSRSRDPTKQPRRVPGWGGRQGGWGVQFFRG